MESSYLHVYESHSCERSSKPDPDKPRYILTEPRAGYRLVAPASLEKPSDNAPRALELP